MAVPALLPLLPKSMSVSFVELGVAIGIFNIVSAVVQAPLGFLVDRVGAKKMLMAALALGAFSFGLVAAFPSYMALVVAMGLAGLANGVYHPADYSLLSHGIESNRMGRAFSIHTFAGFLGGAVAPFAMVGIATAWGLRWSFAASALAGAVALAYVAAVADRDQRSDAPRPNTGKGNDRPLGIPFGTLAILTLLFALLSLSTGSIDKFSVSALINGFGVPLQAANLALTAFLFSSAFGVLAGGLLADRTEKHGLLAAAAFAMATAIVMVVASVALPSYLLVLAMGTVGFLTGVVAPSRDMLVRAASPVGGEGRTFGIVSTGFNVAGVIGPLLFGYLLDHGLPTAVLWTAAVFMIATTVVVLIQEKRGNAQPALAR